MIWNFCIARPVLTAVVFAAIAIFGINGYLRLPVRETPNVEFPVVSVTVVLPGAEPEVIETEIIEPLEEEINTIEGIDVLSSSARAEVALVTVSFELWRGIDSAVQDVRDRVERARRELPDDILEPVVRKMDPDAQAIMWIALTGDERWDEIEMSRYADEVIRPRLETLRGLGQVQIGGERTYAVRVRLDPSLLAAHHLSVQDVVDTIRRNNVDIPTGRLQSEQREFLVKTDGQFSGPEPLRELIIAHGDGAPVRIEDVGDVVAGTESDRSLARFTGEPAVGIGIVKQSDANAVNLARTVHERMRSIGERFPPGLRYTIASDDSRFVEENVRDLIFTIFLVTGLVVVVVLFFLRSVSGTFVTSLAIPTSLLGALAVIDALGFSLNMLSMLALVLAIGIVVDDAIVVLESSVRHMEEGAEPLPATRVGTTEVAFPAIANTLALGAVFIPVAFTQGMIGRFFYEFGVTVTVTVIASTLVALMLTPMLCSRLVRASGKQGRFFAAADRATARAESLYLRVVEVAFRHRLATVGVGVLSFVLGFLALTRVPFEFSPATDREEFMLRFETPIGSTLDASDAYARRIEAVLGTQPEVRHWFLAVGGTGGGAPGQVNQGVSFIGLTPRGERDVHQQDVMEVLRTRLEAVPGGRVFLLSSGGGPPGAPVEFVLQHPDLDTLALGQEQVLAWMREQREFIGVDSDLKLNAPRVRLEIHRDKAAEMGISVADIANSLRFLLGEPDVSKVERGNRRYDVIPEVATKGAMVPEALGDVYVRGPRGELVALSNLVDIHEDVGPSAIHHYNRLRSVTLSASTPPGVTLGDALAKLGAHVESSVPADFDSEFSGRAEAFRESFQNLTLALGLAVIFLYLVLAAQFESLIDPFTILLTLPLAMIGAFGGLWLFGLPLSVYGFIGLIMLMGLVTKNAILLLDYSNVLVERGRTHLEAAREAARVRFRPVVMTAASTMLGMVPIAFGLGAGGEARSPLGVCVAAGVLSSTVLTLVVVPVVYTLIEESSDRVRGWLARRREAGATA
jgi:hydrophobe/amphiphile efflux-1 (HAE1) family protein